MKYLHLFDSKTNHDAVYNGSEYKEPWIACIEENSSTTYDSETIVKYGDGIIRKYKSLTNIGDNGDGSIPDPRTNVVEITIGNTVTNIGLHAFNQTHITNIVIPNSVTRFESWAFQNCYSLSSITIPDSVTSIGDLVFGNCTSLSSITLPDSVTWMGSYIFDGCTSLSSITIPDSVKTMYNYNFNICPNLRNVIIGESTFYECTSLSSITIPDAVTSIGTSAFEKCTNLSSITCMATNAPTLNDNVFKNIYSNGTLHYPNGSDYSTWLAQLPSDWKAVADA